LIHYRSGYKYQLAEPGAFNVGIIPPESIVTPFICLSARGNLYINGGYAWDGATGFPDIPSIMRGSLVHDALYQLMRLGHLPPTCRAQADAMLHRCCLEDGMFKPMAWAVFKAVRLAGSSAASPTNAKPILEAP